MRNLIIIPLYIALTGCPASHEQPETVSSKPADKEPAYAITTMPADPDPALWVLKDEDTTVYLFGTVHILKPGLSWFDEAIKTAFDESDELVVEMIEPDPAAMMGLVNEIAIDKSGVALRDKLSAEDRIKFETAMKKINMPVAAFDPLDPWFASVTMSIIPLTQAGYDTGSGAEDTLRQEAKVRKIKIIGLETVRQQLSFFDDLPEDVQISFLNFTVESIDEVTAGMENMVAHWALGNVDELGELMNAGFNEQIIYDKILVERNANWANWLEKRMDKPGTVFVAVGAGHLAGDESLQAQLAKKGLVSKRIEY